MATRESDRLLCLPLVLTAIADAVAGYFVAALPDPNRIGLGRLALVAGTAAGLHLFGMVEDFLVKRRQDPLLKLDLACVPGYVPFVTAGIPLVLTAGLAGICAVALSAGALVMAIGAFATINFYNLTAKHRPAPISMALMGLFRLLVFGIGVAAAVGVPQPSLWGLSGPLWVRQGVSIFFATTIVTGYSIAAQRGYEVSTLPWRGVFVVTAGAGFIMIAFGATTTSSWFHAPVARVFALLLLPTLWPSRLWSPATITSRPEQYALFIPRMLFWFIVMDAAFLLDGLLLSPVFLK